MKKIRVYMAGACEFEKGDWRAEVRKELEKYDVEALNPWEFEPEQLKGLKPGRLPSEMKTRSGQTMKNIDHWHKLKYAPRDSVYYKRNKKYGRRIIHYDIGLVPKCDYVIVDWSEGTAKGAGTHAECTTAFLNNVPVYILEHKGVDIPAWIEWTATEVFSSREELYKFLEEELGE